MIENNKRYCMFCTKHHFNKNGHWCTHGVTWVSVEPKHFCHENFQYDVNFSCGFCLRWRKNKCIVGRSNNVYDCCDAFTSRSEHIQKPPPPPYEAFIPRLPGEKAINVDGKLKPETIDEGRTTERLRKP